MWINGKWQYLKIVYYAISLKTHLYSFITTLMLPKEIGYAIGCMNNLGMPPTRLDVVAETMKRSQKVAAECQQTLHDCSLWPCYSKACFTDSRSGNNPYMTIYSFALDHSTNSAKFACIGYLLQESGGPHILNKS